MESFFPTPIPSLPSSTTLSVMARSPVLADDTSPGPLCYRDIVTQYPHTLIQCLHIKHRFYPEITG